MTDEEAKRKAWELVNEFVGGCSAERHTLDDQQLDSAATLVDWIASALLEASKPKWRKIEEAPRDETLLCWSKRDECQYLAKWEERLNRFEFEDAEGGHCIPTHFLPLPLPPGE